MSKLGAKASKPLAEILAFVAHVDRHADDRKLYKPGHRVPHVLVQFEQLFAVRDFLKSEAGKVAITYYLKNYAPATTVKTRPSHSRP